VYIPKSKILESKNKFVFSFWSEEFPGATSATGRCRNVTVPTALEASGEIFPRALDKQTAICSTESGTRSPGCLAPPPTPTGCFADGGVFRSNFPQNRVCNGPGVALLKHVADGRNAPGNKGFNFQSQISDSYPRREDPVAAGLQHCQNKSRFFLHRIINSNTFHLAVWPPLFLAPIRRVTPVFRRQSLDTAGAFGNTYSFQRYGWSNETDSRLEQQTAS